MIKQPLIKVKNLNKHFLVKRKILKAANNISFEINEGETIALVGESGCGKTTVGKTILRLIPPTSGEVFYNKENIFKLKEKKFKSYRKKLQIIFQDPFASLNPRMTVKEIIEEPLKIHKIIHTNRAKHLLDLVQMSFSSLNKFPHEFSGGQRQRIGIARALSLNPKFLVLDEPVSALDVSIQAQIINLLKDLQKELKLTFLLIAHDLAVVKYISTKIAVMYLGEIVELANADDLFKNPLHPYTNALIDAVMMLEFDVKNKNRIILKNEMPSPLSPPCGCSFSTRCPKAKGICYLEKPKMTKKSSCHYVSCHFS